MVAHGCAASRQVLAPSLPAAATKRLGLAAEAGDAVSSPAPAKARRPAAPHSVDRNLG
jgi:hypothetical protein